MAFLALAGLIACAPSSDPVDRINVIYDEVIRLMREAPGDAKEKKARIEDYLKSKRAEMEEIRRQLETEMARIKGSEERDAFTRRFDRFLARVREIQDLINEKGLD